MHVHESIDLLMLTHTGSTIVSDDVGVVVGLVVSHDVVVVVGLVVSDDVGVVVGLVVSDDVGVVVGLVVSNDVGVVVGLVVSDDVGVVVGLVVSDDVGVVVGLVVSDDVGVVVGLVVSDDVGVVVSDDVGVVVSDDVGVVVSDDVGVVVGLVGSDDVGVVVGLIVSEAFQHPPHLTHPFYLLLHELPNSSLRLPRQLRYLIIQTHFALAWLSSLRRTASHSSNLSFISFVMQHRPAIPYISAQCVFGLSSIGLRACISFTFIFLLSHSRGIWSSTLFVKAGRLPFFQCQTSPFSCSAGRLRVMVIGL